MRAMRAMFMGWDDAVMPGRRSRQWRAAVATRLRSANTYAVDSALAAVVAVPVSVQFATASPGSPAPLGVLLNAGTVLPLIWRRRAPFAVAVTVAAFAVLVSAYHRPGQDLQYGALLGTYTVADLGRRWQRWTFLAGLVLILGPGALLVKHYGAAGFLFDLLLPLSAYLLGRWRGSAGRAMRRFRTGQISWRADGRLTWRGQLPRSGPG
jgi:hypothetical protein